MNGLLSRFRVILGGRKENGEEEADPLWWPPPPSEVEELLHAACMESRAIPKDSPYEPDRANLPQLDAWRRICRSSESFQVAVAVHAAQKNWGHGGRGNYPNLRPVVNTAIVSQLLRRKLPFTSEHLAYLVTLAAHEEYVSWGFPFNAVLTAVERHCAGRMPPPELQQALTRFQTRIERDWNSTSAGRKLKARIQLLLNPALAARGFELPADGWGAAASGWFSGLNRTQRADWEQLFVHAMTADDRSAPSGKWLDEAAERVAAIGREAVEDRLCEWLRDTDPWKSMRDRSEALFKGLIWSSVHLDHARVATPVGNFAERCFRKEPGYGQVSQKLGNACLVALGMMGDAGEAATALVRLKTRVRYNTVRDRIEGRLSALAEEAGVTVSDLEETSLPRFDMDDEGVSHAFVGEDTAIIRMEADGAVLTWLGPKGEPRKTVPEAVRKNHPAALKTLRRRVRDINDARKAQLARLEASWIEGRDWSFEDWADRYLGHPVRRGFARTLVWLFEAPGRAVALMPDGEGFVDSSGARADRPADCRVRLWHPLDSGREEILAWRRHVLDRGITQAIRQAYREIYAVTDDERATAVYSNRFAAHVLRQHQLRALCHARGWQYNLLGQWDGWSPPTRPVRQRGLTIEYLVEGIENGAYTEADVPVHVSTDRVRFVRGDGTAVELADLPPVVFSEAMRDVDLFVSVTSVATDPGWSDGGPEGMYGDYVRTYEIGELAATAQTRRELLETIMPGLFIAERLKIVDQYLEVQGNLHRYRIHLGTGNVQVLPDHRYLRIVGVRDRNAGRIRLPFSDDPMLSLILSKAFLLSADDEITDGAILSQLPD